MIEERARVVAIENKSVWVEAQRESSCSRCAANKGCGNAVLQKVMGNKRNILSVPNDMPVNIGDEVIIGIDENALVTSSLAVYAVPLLAILLFAALGETFASEVMSITQLAINKDIMSIVGAIVGMLVSIAGLRWYGSLSRNKSKYQPIMLRHAADVTHSPDIRILT